MTLLSPRALCAAIALAGLLFAACAPEERAGGADPASSEGPVAARVDGAAISRSEVERLARASQQSPELALERLIDERLLEAEALRRGLEARADVRLAPKRAMAQLVLRDLEASSADPGAALDALLDDRFAKTQVLLHPEALGPLLGGRP